MDYVLFGIQGSGKGTQGKILAQKFNAAYFETGGELRRLAAENSPLGKKVKSIIEAGHLVPNEVVMEIVECFSNQHTGQPIVFDGITRNKEQNETLEKLLQKMGREYVGVYFELSREEAENRLINRRMCLDCKTVYPRLYKHPVCEKCSGVLAIRADDTPGLIRVRIDIFYKETLPVIEEWKTRGKIIEIDGSGAIEKITQELFSKL